MAGGLSAPAATWLVSYGPIALGVALGIAGRYGQTLHDAGRLAGQSLRADLLQFGVLSLIAIWIADTAHLEGTTRVMAAAMCGAAGDRLFRIALSRFIKRAEGVDGTAGELVATLRASPSTVAEIPAGPEAPRSITIRAAPPETSAPPLQAELRDAFSEVPGQRPPDDQIAALLRMKGPPSPGKQS